MKKLLRWGMLGALLAGLGAAPAAWAQQCPKAATCTPGAAPAVNQAFGFGIVNVTLGALSSTTGVRDGYQDYSCTRQASLVVGRRAAISVQTSAGGPENVRVWLDYNNDGAFAETTELVFSSDNKTQHAGSFVPPASAPLGVALRLRVAADYFNAANGLPTACAAPQYSQTEDYAVVLTANTAPPAAAFTADAPLTCSGCVQFSDQSQNLPTSWRWDFGDGTSSTEPSPRHCYAAPGTYAVTLTATNAAGSSTSLPTPLTYDNRVPVAASCQPATTSYCCNYGIVRFQLGTITQSSADARAGYEDFSCPQRTELRVGEDYPLSISTGGTLNHATRVYLDLNNDGAFTTNELLFNAPDARNPSATLRVAATGAVLDQPLRLRVLADFVGASLTPCGPLTNGQAEDYTVILRASTSPPTVDFASSYGPASCGNAVQFTDLSKGAPTSWRWDFGDGTSSTEQNPRHSYPGPGTYSVRLTATNANGSSTLSRTGFVTIRPACQSQSYCASNGSGPTVGSSSPFWITRVAVIDMMGPLFANETGREPGGYGDYTARPIALSSLGIYAVSVVTNQSIVHRVTMWADRNRDGVFSSNELLNSGLTQAGSNPGPAFYTRDIFLAALSPTSALPPTAGPMRLRVLSTAADIVPNPCGENIASAEVEDYTLLIPGTGLATRAPAALPGLSVFPTPLPAGNLLHLALPEARDAGLYRLQVENLLGAQVLSASRRLGPTLDATLDLGALPPGVYVLRLRDERGREALRRVVRE